LISDNLKRVKNRIAEAALQCGRQPESIRLVAVTKTVPVEKIREAREAGVDVFGENKVQEALEKIDRLGSEGIHWHFIGHLQKNKVRHVVGRFELIHSVDSVDLARLIHLKSVEQGGVAPILIQVNISGEASKSGVAPDELEPLLRTVSVLQGIRVEGLMTIPPFDPDPEKSRRFFSALRGLRDKIARLGIEGISLQELSMGMSHDFPIAIEEGATLVRVGTAIFGERDSG